MVRLERASRRVLAALALISTITFGSPLTAQADPVSDWNAITLLYVVGNPPAVPVGRAGPPGLLDIALVQLAVHDAVQAIQGDYQPYAYDDPSKRGVGQPAAAVAAAAHRVLVRLYPGQAGPLDIAYNAYLAANGLAGDPALAVGEAAAVAVHGAHYRPTVATTPFFGVNAPGQWYSPAAQMAFLNLAFTEPYTLNRASQFRPGPPPPMTSDVYRREYEEVQAIGKSTAHPNADTDKARFWAGNYWVQWNEALRQIAGSASLNVGDSARLFALANTAAADAAIAVWDSKYFYNFWRPDMAIRGGDGDGNPRTIADTTWSPFLANPAYPDYVSGANGLTGAFTGMLQEYFAADEFAFSVKNPNPLLINKERFFQRFSEAAQEVVDARILLGIHFRSADEEARRLGNRVAHWTFQKFLGPVPGSHNKKTVALP